jgi:ABC-2 type transport system ATP-binding protein
LRSQLFTTTLAVRTRQPLPDPDAVFAGLPAVDGWREADDAYVIAVSDPAVAAPEVTRALVGAGADVLSLSEPRRSLQDVYLEIIGDEGSRK